MAGTWCAFALLAVALLSMPVAAVSGPGWPLFWLQAACAGMMVMCALPVLAVGDGAACFRSAAIGLVGGCVGYAADDPVFAALGGIGLLMSLTAYALRPAAMRNLALR